jgi:hypothetical protein
MRPGVRWSVCENLQEIEAELQIGTSPLVGRPGTARSIAFFRSRPTCAKRKVTGGGALTSVDRLEVSSDTYT